MTFKHYIELTFSLDGVSHLQCLNGLVIIHDEEILELSTELATKRGKNVMPASDGELNCHMRSTNLLEAVRDVVSGEKLGVVDKNVRVKTLRNVFVIRVHCFRCQARKRTSKTEVLDQQI